MVEMYKGAKRTDRVLYNIPIDFLSFVRYFAWDQLVAGVAKSYDGDLLSYNMTYDIFKKLGLIPFNMDLSKWTKDMI